MGISAVRNAIRINLSYEPWTSESCFHVQLQTEHINYVHEYTLDAAHCRQVWNTKTVIISNAGSTSADIHVHTHTHRCICLKAKLVSKYGQLNSTCKPTDYTQKANRVDNIWNIPQAYWTHGKPNSYRKPSICTVRCKKINAEQLLTLWRPLLPCGHSYKASCARLG